MPGPKPLPISVTEAQRHALQALLNKASEEHTLVLRAHIVLMAEQGHSTRHIARFLHVSEDTVADWKQRWRDTAQIGLGETNVRKWLADAPRCGGPSTFTAEQWCQIMAIACEDPKESGRPISHWSAREVADEAIRRQVVETISESHVARFFKRSRP